MLGFCIFTFIFCHSIVTRNSGEKVQQNLIYKRQVCSRFRPHLDTSARIPVFRNRIYYTEIVNPLTETPTFRKRSPDWFVLDPTDLQIRVACQDSCGRGLTMAEPDRQIRRKGDGGGHPVSEIREAQSPKNVFFSALRASVWSKNKGACGPPGPSPRSALPPLSRQIRSI